MDANTVVWAGPELTLTLDRARGRILSGTRAGRELLMPSLEAFSLQLRNRVGDAVLLRESDFADCGYADGVFEYRGCPALPTLNVELRIRQRERFIAFSNAVAGVPADWALEWIDAPQVSVPKDRTLFQPLHDGVLVTDPDVRNHTALAYHPIEFTKRGQAFGSMFPGRCMMQFLADYDDRSGVFMAAFDEQCIPKAMEYEPLAGNVMRLSMQTFTGCGFGSGYTTPFEYVLTGFAGDWMCAATLYREWYEQHAPAPRPFPAWLEKSPVAVIYPVLGTGLDHGKHQLKPNCYYPYRNALPYLQNLKRGFDSPVLALLMHWEGTAPWAPPYIWPPLGGEAPLAELRDALHAEGDLLGLYASGTAWTQTSSINDYSMRDRCRSEGLERYMLRGPHGEIDAAVCNGEDSQRQGYDLCLCEAWSQRQICGEVFKAAQFGVDYCQSFDQNHGGEQHICYSQQHHHPPVPGPAQTESVRQLLQKLTDGIRRRGSNMVLGCESSAAEPFVDALQLNDARPNFLWPRGTPVPAQSFVFHGRTLCFAGNQGGIAWSIKNAECPENLLFREAYAFNAGDLLAVTLKEAGHIHWGWCLEWEVPGPDQESIITLVRNLNAVRKKYPNFLLYGRMLEPLLPVRAGTWTLKLAGRDVELPSILHNSWAAPDGERCLIVTNYLPRAQTATVGTRTLELPALSAAVLAPDGTALTAN